MGSCLSMFKGHAADLGEDLLWTFFQIIFLQTLLELSLLTMFNWSYRVTFGAVEARLPEVLTLEAPPWLEAGLAMLVTMLAIDCAAYCLHRAMHAVPALWRLHKVHHSAAFLTPFSAFRQHPLEPLLLKGVRGLAAGIALGLLHAFFPQCTPVWAFSGMGFGFFLYMFTVNLHHAPIPVCYPRILRSWLISPHIHHLHHSQAQRHHDKNFGVVFSLWDQMFSSYLDEEVQLGELVFGLAAVKADHALHVRTDRQSQTELKIYRQPD